jgi:hypothetical protein
MVGFSLILLFFLFENIQVQLVHRVREESAVRKVTLEILDLR